MKNELTFVTYDQALKQIKDGDKAFALYAYLHGDKFDSIEELRKSYEKSDKKSLDLVAKSLK
jgi:hypothetical protein